MFGSAYQEAGVSPADRPEYGALNLMSHADGASPRFGSCYLELQPHVTRQCSLTWGDSYERPKHVGTSDVFEHIALAPFDTCVTVATGTSRFMAKPSACRVSTYPRSSSGSHPASG